MWTMGNVALPPWYTRNFRQHLKIYPFYLRKENATATEEIAQSRLDIRRFGVKNQSLITILVISGLVSIMLTLLSRPSTIFHSHVKDGQDIPIDGTGILHAIGLYRNHAELVTLLDQVKHPTDKNLRDAGMVRIDLIGGRFHRRKRSKLF